eukprot:scaffold124266_cov33-Tisochrysis_lutea.AAC.4
MTILCGCGSCPMYSLNAVSVENPPRAQNVMSPVWTKTSPGGTAMSCSCWWVSETRTTRRCALDGGERSSMGTTW